MTLSTSSAMIHNISTSHIFRRIYYILLFTYPISLLLHQISAFNRPPALQLLFNLRRKIAADPHLDLSSVNLMIYWVGRAQKSKQPISSLNKKVGLRAAEDEAFTRDTGERNATRDIWSDKLAKSKDAHTKGSIFSKVHEDDEEGFAVTSLRETNHETNIREK